MNDLELAKAAAARGAEIVCDGFGSHKVVEQKGRLDPVTEIDRASEKAIVDLLTTHRPDDGLLGEEGSARHSTGRRWIIDPLDGTVNFVHGIPQVGVSVALYDGDAPLVGVVPTQSGTRCSLPQRVKEPPVTTTRYRFRRVRSYTSR